MIGLTVQNGCIVLNRDESGGMAVDNGLRTSVLLSLFSDQRASAAESLDGSTRGWWGDSLSRNENDRIGSKIWTLVREKNTAAIERGMEVRAKQALQWLIEDGVAESVDAFANAVGSTLELQISIKRPKLACNDRYSFQWDATGKLI